MKHARAIVLLFIALGTPAVGFPDGAPAPDASASEAGAPVAAAPVKHASRFRDPQDGQIDISAFLASPRAFLPIPLVITEPAVGYGGGLAGMFIRPRPKSGGEGFSRPNMSVIAAFATENGTKGAFAGDASRWVDGRLKTLMGGGTGKINLDFYGLGSDDESLDEAISYSLDFSAAILQGNWELRRGSPWALGLRYVYAKVEPKLDEDAPFPGLLDGIDVEVSAPGAILEFDTRDNLFTPTSGVYAETFYMHSLEDLGASEDFERFQQVLMGWFPIADRVTIGLRGDYQWSSEGTPFFLKPYIKLRGVPAMRYQGEEMASVEAEVRWQVHGRWSLVGAAGYGSARTRNDLFSRTKDVTSGAVGFRYEMARKFGMHLGMDVGFSNDTTAVYLQVGNAWFRP